MEENDISDSTAIIDAAVSFAGTWAKRGFTSLTGVVFVNSIDTGEVLDYHVMSKSCRKCSLQATQCQGHDEQFEEWRRHIVTSIFKGVLLLWKQKGLLFFGTDLFIFIT